MRDVSHASPVSRWLTHGVDFGLASIVLVAPLFMSGRHAVGLFVFVLLTTLTFVCWTLRQAYSRGRRLRFTGAEWIWLAGALLLAVQVTPLPAGALEAISPSMAELLPLRTGETSQQLGLTSWTQISLDPNSTRGTLVLLMAYAMLFTVATNRIRKIEDAEKILKGVGVAVGIFSVFALVQSFATANNTFAFYDIPDFTRTSGSRGPFPNPNHFGHMVALGVGPLLIWIRRAWLAPASGNSRSWLSGDLWGKFVAPCLLAIAVVAAILTFSRAAALSVAGVVVVTAALCSFKGIWDRRSTVVVVVTLIIAGIGVGLNGLQRVSNELSTLGDGIEGADNSQIRRGIWAADWNAVQSFPVLGVGGGTHREVYRAFLDRHFEFEAGYSENCYLQILTEAGGLGATILLAGILLGTYWAFRSLRGNPDGESERRWLVAIACIAGLLASLAHATVDFIWYVPTCASFALLFLAIVCRVGTLGEQGSARQPTMPRNGWLAFAAVSICVTAFMVGNRLPPLRAYSNWQSYLDLSFRGNTFNPNSAIPTPHDVDPNNLANIDRMLKHLRAVVELDPTYARAHVRLANLLERQFEIQQTDAENAMPLAQFRDAAYASGFKSKEAQEEWLSRAMGENRALLDEALQHARLGLRQCPMYGEAYCSLSALAFLEGYGPEKSKALIEQARLVRPHEGVVLLTAGIQAVKDGDIETAQALLKTVFNQEPRFQREIIQLFGFTVPPQAMLTMFEPEYAGLKSLYHFYREHRIAEGVQVAGAAYAAELESVADSQQERGARNLFYAQAVYREIGRGEDALRCAKRAAELAPRDVDIRHELGRRLAEAGQFEEALECFKWCAIRSPHDPAIREEMAQVNRLRLAPRQIGSTPSGGTLQR